MRPINPDKIAPWFDPRKLKAEFLIRGYDNYGPPLARILYIEEHTATDKVSESRFKHVETLEIAKALHFTPKQYCDIFCKDVFKEEDPSE